MDSNTLWSVKVGISDYGMKHDVISKNVLIHCTVEDTF